MLNITIDGKELKDIIEKVSAAMLKKATAPTLGWVVLKAEGRKLSASVTSIETWLEVNTDYFTSLSDGKVAIDKEDLKVITRMTGNVNIIEAEENVIIKNGKKTITLQKYDLSNYPELETEENTEKLRYTESELFETINNLSVFCSDDECNKMMQFINFNLRESRIEALDGHRIGLKRIEDTEKLCNDGNLLLHVMAVKDLKRALNKKSNNIVTITEGEKYIVVTGRNFKYYQWKIEGKYFMVSQLINNYYDYSFKADTTKTLAHFKYYIDNVISKSDRFPVVLKIKNEKIITYGKNTRFETSDELEIKDFSGNEVTIGFNPYFLVDALKIADADNVIISGNNSKTPIYMDADKYSFLILPVRVQKEEMEKYLNKVNAA